MFSMLTGALFFGTLVLLGVLATVVELWGSAGLWMIPVVLATPAVMAWLGRKEIRDWYRDR
jgi:hypothetical protein